MACGCMMTSTKNRANSADGDLVTFDKATSIKTGMPMVDVEKIMGSPTSSGVENGVPFNRYDMLETRAKTFTVFLFVATHLNSTIYPVGYDLQVFYENGAVTRTVLKNHVSEAGDNSK